MSAVARIIMFAAFLLSALLYCGCSPQREVISSSVSKQPVEAKYEYGPGYARYLDNAVKVEVSYMSPAALDVYFSRFRGGMYKNPFPPDTFVVFSLEFYNRGDSVITFNPRMTLFVTEKSCPLSTKDFASLYADFSLAEAHDLDERMEAYRASSFDTSETINPGERLQKLIVYTRTEEVSGGGLFMFNGLYVGHEERAVVLKYMENVGL